MQEIKGHMMDLRTVDGSILKITTPNGEQELAKTLGVEMVQNMYKVNVEDINQLLAYHEVFGKLQNEMVTAGQPTNSTTVTTTTSQPQQPAAAAITAARHTEPGT